MRNRTFFSPSNGRGFSFTELIVAMGLFGLLLAFLQVGSKWHKTSLDAMEKTDVTAKLRNSSVVLGRLLSQCTEFLYPAKITPAWTQPLIFRNRDNEIGALFINKANTLCYYNYTLDSMFEITPFSSEFKARLVKPNLVEYQIVVKKDEFEFAVSNKISAMNSAP